MDEAHSGDLHASTVCCGLPYVLSERRRTVRGQQKKGRHVSKERKTRKTLNKRSEIRASLSVEVFFEMWC